MFRTLQSWLIPSALLLAVGMAILIDYQKASVPMQRPAPRHPVYVLDSPRYTTSLQKGKAVLAMGPWCYGVFTGAQAFSSVEDASEFIRLKGLNPDSLQIYQVSGDYQLDVTEGVLNKTLQLVEPKPYRH